MTAEISEEPVVLSEEDTEEPSPEAPFGWMKDPDTGERRPRKRPGRRPKTAKVPAGPSPSIADLQALGSLPEAAEDTTPGAPPKGRRRTAMKAEAQALPPFRAGPIAKWVNTQYRRVGRVVRMMDYDVGTAIIACTRRPPVEDDDEDTGVTVGDAWENLAKNNPRVRRFILKCMTGGLVGELFWAHAPIFLALIMKDGIRSRLPILGLVEALMSDEPQDQDAEPEGGDMGMPGLGGLLGGLRPEDMAQMMAMGQTMMSQMANGVPRPANGPRPPDVMQPHPYGVDIPDAGGE